MLSVGELQAWCCCKQRRSLAVVRERCSSLGFWFFWSHAARGWCWTVLAAPASARESRKNLEVLQNTKHWKDVQRTCARMAQGRHLPCAEVPAVGCAIQKRRTTTVVSAWRHMFSWGENALDVNYKGPGITVTHEINPICIFKSLSWSFMAVISSLY